MASEFLRSLQLGVGQGAGTPKHSIADFLFRRGKSITMRSRLTGDLIEAVFDARTLAAIYGDDDMFEATSLVMELWVSEDGKGRQEGVDVHKSVYNTNVGGPPATDEDPALQG